MTKANRAISVVMAIALAISTIFIFSPSINATPATPKAPKTTITTNSTSYVKIKSSWSKVSGKNISYEVQFQSSRDIGDPWGIAPGTYSTDSTSKTIKYYRGKKAYKIKTRVRSVQRNSKGKISRSKWSGWSNWVNVKVNK